MRKWKGRPWLYLPLLLLSGCALYAGLTLDDRFGKAQPRERLALSAEARHYLDDVKPVLEQRCVVCHACYDAPCQLKLSSSQGLDRGASKALVYEGTRLVAASPSRLFIDAASTQEWRQKGFYAVLNERDQSPQANTQAGVLARMLALKAEHPLPEGKHLGPEFTLGLDRSQQCPTIEEMDSFEKNQPLWGMPYGLPGLDKHEHQLLMDWVAKGAPMAPPAPLSEQEQQQLAKWEGFLNDDSLKGQLVARYIYEHLFFAHLYFADEQSGTPRFFELVRSASAPGQPLEPIASRRPFDDPGVARVYYRLVPVPSTIVDKTHMPYALDEALMARWQALFFERDYQVTALPSYAPDVAANPLVAFAQLPAGARYRFMLDRAQYTIMGFIKGPVCRGQVALNVINDRFWVYFVDPAFAEAPEVASFYRSQRDNLHMPAEKESTALAMNWLGYAKRQGDYLKARSDFMNKTFADGRHLTLDGIWDGDGHNRNATLTVLRHFDSATVTQGLVGEPPKTAWVLDYALLERIHYLLVAGFDVYGNYGHQLLTRLYMDFLRMEGESNFLALLPADERRRQFKAWYKGAGKELSGFIDGDINRFDQPTGVHYQSQDTKAELFAMLAKREAKVQPRRYQLDQAQLGANALALLTELGHLQGRAVHLFPELTFIAVEPAAGGDAELFTLVRNSAHSNISSLFDEASNRDLAADDVTLVHGLLGSYPGAFWQVKESELAALVAKAQAVKDEASYQALLDSFAVRRTAPDFWAFSDRLNRLYRQRHPIEAGLLDYNRLENR
ncbi:fatty acid cis/trans isomerase [Gallaecimonas xiamenensis]|uniref:Fatty acid cistrans isomerase n=1 Tax=Gallaecimonas xiamenensis 3-C-1 TaxID=745411 RepID=K2JM21_9GAMM|nr:fatty acid cis/trans isomerase [Gallaecimonas xiamenensis]EKE75467.1 fatty acid cistrans isomerase [Gallaecimonas xiamenensis 3-C-1]